MTAIADLPGRRRRATIYHAPLRGVTPEMLLWWFTHLRGTVELDGVTVDRYLAWHPLDHIRWELVRPDARGGAGEGARFRIVEAFGRDERHYIDTTERVEKLDRSGIRLVRRVAGIQVFQLEHTWSRGPSGTHYVSVMDVGAQARAFVPINAYLNARVFPRQTMEAWLQHNVEEVGVLEQLLPGLYAREVPPRN